MTAVATVHTDYSRGPKIFQNSKRPTVQNFVALGPEQDFHAKGRLPLGLTYEAENTKVAG